LAINAFTRQRNVDYLSAIFAVVAPSGAQKAVTQFRGVVFPEEALDDAAYAKKAAAVFEKMRNVTLYIKPA